MSRTTTVLFLGAIFSSAGVAQNSSIPYYRYPGYSISPLWNPVPSMDVYPAYYVQTAASAGAADYCGTDSIGGPYLPKAFRGGQYLPPLVGFRYCAALCMNESGWVVGNSTTAASTGLANPKATLWKGTQAEAVPTLMGAGDSVAAGISNDGKIVGYSDGGGSRYFMVVDGTAIDLGPGSPSRMRVNNAGTVVVAEGSKVYENGVWKAGIGAENDINDLGHRTGKNGIFRNGKLFGMGTTQAGMEINSRDWVAAGSLLWTPTTGPMLLEDIGDNGDLNGGPYTARGIDELGYLGVTFSETNNLKSGLARPIGQFEVLGIRSLETVNGLTVTGDMSSAWELADEKTVSVARLNRAQGAPPMGLVMEGQGTVLAPTILFFRVVASGGTVALTNPVIDFWNWTSNRWEATSQINAAYGGAFKTFTAEVTGNGLDRFVRQSDGRWRARFSGLTTANGAANQVNIDLAAWIVK